MLNPQERAALLDSVSLHQAGTLALGDRQWMLVWRFGRFMSGPFSGLYVSGVPTAEGRRVLQALLRGEVQPVHLMHRHRSGNYEASSLVLRDSRLVMLFDDREELA